MVAFSLILNLPSNYSVDHGVYCQFSHTASLFTYTGMDVGIGHSTGYYTWIGKIGAQESDSVLLLTIVFSAYIALLNLLTSTSSLVDVIFSVTVVVAVLRIV